MGAALIVMPISCSPKGDDHHSEEGGHSEHGHHDHGTNEKLEIPATVAGIIDKIHHIHHELGETVEEKRLADVHQQAFAIRDLANALPGKVAADKKTKVGQTVTQIGEIAVELDNSGDSGKQAQTEANLKKLDGLLKMLDAQVGVKKDDHVHSHGDHHDH